MPVSISGFEQKLDTLRHARYCHREDMAGHLALARVRGRRSTGRNVRQCRACGRWGYFPGSVCGRCVAQQLVPLPARTPAGALELSAGERAVLLALAGGPMDRRQLLSALGRDTMPRGSEPGQPPNSRGRWATTVLERKGLALCIHRHSRDGGMLYQLTARGGDVAARDLE